MARHNTLIDQLLKLGGAISVRSGLNVDPSPQTAVLIQIATHDVPEALIASGNVRWYATRASIKGYLGAEDRLALQLYHDDFADHFDTAAGGLDRASEETKQYLRPAVESARSAFDVGYGTIQGKILDTQKLEITTADLYAATREISSTLQHLSDVSYSAMDAAVQQRLSQVTTGRNLTAGITATALVCALLLSWLITHAHYPNHSLVPSQCSATFLWASTITRLSTPARTKRVRSCRRSRRCKASYARRSRLSAVSRPRTRVFARPLTRSPRVSFSPMRSTRSSI